MTAGTLERMRQATRADELLYAHVLQRLYAEIRHVESRVGVRIMCDW